jgi:hypothetical protein
VTTSLILVSPQSATRIDPAETEIVVRVVDSATHPARQLDVSVDVATVLTWIGGVVTALDPDFTVTITTPETGTTLFTLNKLTDWTNPSKVAIGAVYQPNPDVLPLTTTSVVISADLVLEAANPGSQQLLNSTTAAISFVVTSTATITGLTAYVNDNEAFSLNGGSLIWSRPNFSGTVINAGSLISGSVFPRRGFARGQEANVNLDVQITTDGIFFVQAPIAYTFYVTPPVAGTTNLALQTTQLDAPFRGLPALEAQRVTLLAALRSRAQAPSLSVLAYARVLRSSLAPIAKQLDATSLEREASALPGIDLTDTIVADQVLAGASILWEPALNEALRLGADPLLIGAVERAYAAPYPQERIAAASLLLLAAAN